MGRLHCVSVADFVGNTFACRRLGHISYDYITLSNVPLNYIKDVLVVFYIVGSVN